MLDDEPVTVFALIPQDRTRPLPTFVDFPMPEPHKGSTPMTCDLCGQVGWIGPTQKQQLDKRKRLGPAGNYQLLCLYCVVNDMADGGPLLDADIVATERTERE